MGYLSTTGVWICLNFSHQMMENIRGMHELFSSSSSSSSSSCSVWPGDQMLTAGGIIWWQTASRKTEFSLGNVESCQGALSSKRTWAKIHEVCRKILFVHISPCWVCPSSAPVATNQNKHNNRTTLFIWQGLHRPNTCSPIIYFFLSSVSFLPFSNSFPFNSFIILIYPILSNNTRSNNSRPRKVSFSSGHLSNSEDPPHSRQIWSAPQIPLHQPKLKDTGYQTHNMMSVWNT